MRLAGKTAIITGGANGIGLAACERSANEGAHVIMADFDETRASRCRGRHECLAIG